MNYRYGYRFGVVTPDNVKHWFYTAVEAVIYKSKHGGKIIKGILHNDEGCTPWIETVWTEKP